MPNSDWATSATPTSTTRTMTDVLGGAALPTNVSHFGSLANAVGYLRNDGSGNFSYTEALVFSGGGGAVTGSIYKGAGGGLTIWSVTGSTYDFSLLSAAGSHVMNIMTGTINVKFQGAVGFNGTNPLAKPTISGSRGGNAALASLLTALANYGLITDSTTA